MKIKNLTKHAKQKLLERFDLRRLPDGPREFIASESSSRKIYRIGEVYFVWAKSTHKIITFLTAEMVRRRLRKEDL